MRANIIISDIVRWKYQFLDFQQGADFSPMGLMFPTGNHDFHMNMMMIITIIRRWMALLWRPYHHCHCSWKLSWLSIALIIIVVIFFIVINYMSPCYPDHHKCVWSGVTMSMWYLTTETIPRLRFSISDTGISCKGANIR